MWQEAFFMIQGKVEPGDLVAYTMYVTTLLTTIRRIIEFAEQFQRGITGIERFRNHGCGAGYQGQQKCKEDGACKGSHFL